MKQKRICIYARVSTTEQAEEGYSIEAQINTIKSICTGMGHTIVEIYTDRGISGKSMANRQALLKMLDDATKGKFDEVVVWKINRLARNHLDLLKIVDILEKANVHFRSITEPFDTSNPAGKLLLNMLASIGEFERESIVENVKSGMAQRAKQGYFNGGRMLGYKSITTEGCKGASTLVIDEKEANVVKLVFSLYTSGKGYKYIANHLNDLGYKTIRNNNYSLQSVRSILTNPTYVGKIQYNKYVNHSKQRRKSTEDEFILVDGVHDPIINQETWDQTQKLMELKSKRTLKSITGTFLLTGILKCPVCGASMVVGRASSKDKSGEYKRWNYYQCSRYKNIGKHECKANSIGAEYAEEFVINKIVGLSLDDKLIEDVVLNINKQVNNTIIPLKDRIKQLDSELSSSDLKKEKVFNLYEEGLIDKNTFSLRMAQLNNEIDKNNKLKDGLNKLIKECKQVEKIPIEKVKSILAQFGQVLNIASREQKKLLLNMVIERVTVDKDRKIGSIDLKFDEKIQRYFITDKEDSSNKEESSLFVFSLTI